MAETVKKEEPKKKGPFSKLKEGLDDKEEQLAIPVSYTHLTLPTKA